MYMSPSGCFSSLQKWSIDINKLILFVGVISWNIGEHNLSVDQYSETGSFLFLTISTLIARNV